ncbi:MAG: MATE family efflux transporter [Bacteroidota bacterium]
MESKTAKDGQKELILNEKLTKVMWKLSLPAIAAMMLFGLNAFMDTVYIGQLLDEVALAGVSLAYPLTSIMMGFGSWAGTGAGNLLSIAIGKGDEEQQSKLLANTSIMMFITSLMFAVPAYFFAEELIKIMGGTGEVLVYGVRYFKVSVLSTPFWVFGLGFNFIVRGEGKMKEAAVMFIYGLAINLILTPVFIYYFGLGVEGAAWATNIGMLIYTVVGYFYFATGRASFNANINSLKYDAEVFKQIIKLGFPGFIMTVMGVVQAVVVFNAIVGVGNEGDLAFFAASNRILLFLMTPLFGLMRALQPVIGVNYGAENYQRVRSSFILFCKTGFLLVFPFWLAMSLFPQYCLGLVLPNVVFDAQSLWNFRVYMFMLPFLPFVFNALTFLPAIEQPKYASIVGMARQLVFYVPVMLLLPRYIGLSGVYYGTTAIDLVITLWMSVIVYRQMKKLPNEELAEVSVT